MPLQAQLYETKRTLGKTVKWLSSTSCSERRVCHKKTQKTKQRSPNFCSVILKQPLCFGGGLTPLGTVGTPPASSFPPKLSWTISTFQDSYWSVKQPKQQIPLRRGSSYSQVPSADPPSLCHGFKGEHLQDQHGNRSSLSWKTGNPSSPGNTSHCGISTRAAHSSFTKRHFQS